MVLHSQSAQSTVRSCQKLSVATWSYCITLHFALLQEGLLHPHLWPLCLNSREQFWVNPIDNCSTFSRRTGLELYIYSWSDLIKEGWRSAKGVGANLLVIKQLSTSLQVQGGVTSTGFDQNPALHDQKPSFLIGIATGKYRFWHGTYVRM